jgi:hypothetical protein
MRYISRKLLSSSAALLLVSGTALAANPHVIESKTRAVQDAQDNLDVSFKIAGLGAGEQVVVTVSADFSATFECRTKNGNLPSDPKKQQILSNVGTSGLFTADAKGNVEGTLELSVEGANVDFTCPSGLVETVSEVDFDEDSVDVTFT